MPALQKLRQAMVAELAARQSAADPRSGGRPRAAGAQDLLVELVDFLLLPGRQIGTSERLQLTFARLHRVTVDDRVQRQFFRRGVRRYDRRQCEECRKTDDQEASKLHCIGSGHVCLPCDLDARKGVIGRARHERRRMMGSCRTRAGATEHRRIMTGTRPAITDNRCRRAIMRVALPCVSQ
jgi:hypothetical protein